MTTVEKAEAKNAYADRMGLEKAARMARTLGQWELATKHYESALALLTPDPHRGEHIDAGRYRREIVICTRMAGTSKGLRPTRDNDAYKQLEREHNRKVEDFQNTFWSPE